MKRFAWFLVFATALAGALPARAAALPVAATDSVVSLCDGRFVPVGWQTRPLHPCNGDSVSIVFRSCRECVDLIDVDWTRPGPITVRTRSPIYCPRMTACTPDSVELSIGRLAAGHFQINFDVVSDIVTLDSVVCSIVRHDRLQFDVGLCEPPPPPGALPFVTKIRIGGPGPCLLDCPPRICPGESIFVYVNGVFPDNCHALRRIEVLPARLYDPSGLVLPIVRLIVDDFACLGRPCILGEFPFTGSVFLPPRPSGFYQLEMQEAQVTCSDSVGGGDSIYVTHVPFEVAERCSSEVAGCLMPVFPPPKGRCNAFVAPDQPARVDLGVTSSVALAGLQGEFSLFPAGLRIRNLEPIGPAIGMHLQWTQTSGGGARFVMFADQGAPIGGDGVDSAGNFYRRTDPVLRVTIVQPPGVRAEPSTQMTVGLLGSTIEGTSVSECPTLTTDRFAPISAFICSGTPCDFNGDGRTDVRDLVMMVHCVLHTGPCPDSTQSFDCNGDGFRTLDDVLCCARVILRGGGGVDDSLPRRPEPAVQVSFGEPVRTATGLDVAIHLAGADRIGAARLALSFPRDRFDIGSVERMGESASWLDLYELTDDALILGLIGLESGGAQSTAQDVELMLHLTLKPGQEPGGELRVGSAEFSGPDGAALKVDLGAPALTIAGRTTLAITATHPNPFSDETRFTLSLSRAADADLAVLDLSGRKVAVLHHGRLDAGGHSFAWRGTRADGSRAPEGVYFLRARAGGETASRRVVLLRSH